MTLSVRARLGLLGLVYRPQSIPHRARQMPGSTESSNFWDSKIVVIDCDGPSPLRSWSIPLEFRNSHWDSDCGGETSAPAIVHARMGPRRTP